MPSWVRFSGCLKARRGKSIGVRQLVTTCNSLDQSITRRGATLNDINWPEVMTGFSLGLVPLVARQLYILINYTTQSSRKKFLGNLWAYHRSTVGDGTIIEAHYRVKILFAHGPTSPPNNGIRHRPCGESAIVCWNYFQKTWNGSLCDAEGSVIS